MVPESATSDSNSSSSDSSGKMEMLQLLWPTSTDRWCLHRLRPRKQQRPCTSIRDLALSIVGAEFSRPNGCAVALCIRALSRWAKMIAWSIPFVKDASDMSSDLLWCLKIRNRYRLVCGVSFLPFSVCSVFLFASLLFTSNLFCKIREQWVQSIFLSERK